jgi:hypothetical protein
MMNAKANRTARFGISLALSFIAGCNGKETAVTSSYSAVMLERTMDQNKDNPSKILITNSEGIKEAKKWLQSVNYTIPPGQGGSFIPASILQFYHIYPESKADRIELYIKQEGFTGAGYLSENEFEMLYSIFDAWGKKQ